MKIGSGKWDTIFDFFEGLTFAIPFLIITAIGATFKFIILNLIAVFTFNKTVQLKKLWTKENIMSYFSDVWNFVIAIGVFVLFIILKRI